MDTPEEHPFFIRVSTAPRPHWFRFSLRTLMLVVALICVGFGGLGFMWRQTQDQRSAVEQIQKLGGSVRYEHTVLPNCFANVSDVDLSRTQITDADLEYLRPLTRLRRLELRHTQITDAGLANLRRLPWLGCLDLEATKVTDAGLIHIKGMRYVYFLGLSDTEVTDAGLVNLKGWTQLESLYLNNTKVTDAGLVHLQAMPQLDWVCTEKTQVTLPGRQELFKTLPKCK
jgi:hypothetical protein